MRLLLDTHIALRAITDDPALPRAARSLILDPGNSVYVSAVNVWEISIKHALKRSSMQSPDPKRSVSLASRDTGFWT